MNLYQTTTLCYCFVLLLFFRLSFEHLQFYQYASKFCSTWLDLCLYSERAILPDCRNLCHKQVASAVITPSIILFNKFLLHFTFAGVISNTAWLSWLEQTWRYLQCRSFSGTESLPCWEYILYRFGYLEKSCERNWGLRMDHRRENHDAGAWWLKVWCRVGSSLKNRNPKGQVKEEESWGKAEEKAISFIDLW